MACSYIYFTNSSTDFDTTNISYNDYSLNLSTKCIINTYYIDMRINYMIKLIYSQISPSGEIDLIVFSEDA